MADSDIQITIGVDASAAGPGADQAKSAIAGVAPQVQALSKTFDDLGKSLKGGFDSVGQIAKALSDLGKAGGGQLQSVSTGVSALGSAVASVGQSAPGNLKAVSAAAGEVSVNVGAAAEGGASKLSALSSAAGGVVGVVTAVGQVALMAGEAMLQWAQQTENSSSASASARQHAADLVGAVNGASKAFGDVGSVLANALAPTLTQIIAGVGDLAKGFTQSYNSGGLAKTAVDAINLTLQFAAALVAGVGTAFIVAFDWVKGAISAGGAVWDLFVDSFKGQAKQVMDQVVTTGRIIYDSLTNNTLGAARDMRAGWLQMQKDAADTATKIAADAAKIKTAFMQGGGNEAGAVVQAGDDFLAKPGQPQPDKTGGGSGGKGGSSSPGGGKQGGASSDAMAQYKAALAQLEDETRASTGQWLADLSQMDLNYWQGILEHAKLSSKERAEITHTVAELEKKVNGDAQTDQLAQDRARIEADKGNTTALWTDWRNYVNDMAKAYGEGTRQVINASREMTAALKANDKDATAAAVKAAEDAATGAEREAQSQVKKDQTDGETALAALKARFEAGKISATAYYAQVDAMRSADAASEVQTIKLGLLAEEMSLNAQIYNISTTKEQREALLKQEVAAEQAAADVIAKIWADTNKKNTNKKNTDDQTQALDKFKQQWSSFVNPMVSTFSNGLLKMAEGTQTFAATMRLLGQQVLNDMLRVIDRMVEQWLWSQVAQTVANAAGNEQRTASDAGAAAASAAVNKTKNAQIGLQDAKLAFQNVYASVSNIPIVGWLLAPPAAAAAFAAVMAYSAEGGFDIPAGMNPLTQLHAQEMVLPARIAQPAKAFFEGMSSSAGGFGGGDVHNHFGDFVVHGGPSGMSSSEFRQALSDHATHVAAAVLQGTRQGVRGPRGGPSLFPA